MISHSIFEISWVGNATTITVRTVLNPFSFERTNVTPVIPGGRDKT
jgi:hypothetical protein